MLRLALVPLFAALLAGCSGCPSVDAGADGGGIIYVGPEGGIIVREGVVLNVPSGALDKQVTLSVTPTDEGIPEVPGRVRISRGYRIAPSSVTFQKDITLYVPYDEAKVPSGVTPDTFDLRRNNAEAEAAELADPDTDTGRKVVSAKTASLGLFWATAPASTTGNTLAVEPAELFMRVGDTQALTVSLTDGSGAPVEGVLFTYGVAPRRVATVSPEAVVTATGPGNATVTVRYQTLTATVKVYVQGDTVGPSTFVHENPFPTGNDLWGGTLLGPGALFVGGNATVLAFDGTGAWSRLFSSPMVRLRAIAAVGQTDLVAVGQSGNTGVLVSASAAAPTPALQLFPDIEPRALWYDGTHGMAVGFGNDVIVRRGGAWVSEYSPSFETLLDVGGDGAGGFTTVGSRGSLYRYDPATQAWNSLFQTRLSVLLTAATLAVPDGSEAWAVGGNKLWHFQGSGWTAENLPSDPPLTELTAVRVLDGKVVLGGRAGTQGWLLVRDPALTAQPPSGTPGAPLILNGWLAQPMRGPQLPRGLVGGAGGGYAVGDLGAVWRYAGGTFTELSHGFYGDVADVYTLPGGVSFAAVNSCDTQPCQFPVGKVVARGADGGWSELGTQPFAEPVYSVAARSPTEVYAGSASALFRYDGQAWSLVPVIGNQSVPLRDLQLCGDELWAVGDFGTVYAGGTADGGLRNQPQLGGGDLYAIHCPQPGNVWIAGDGVLFENRAARDSDELNHGAWRSVWSPGPEEAFAFGDARYGVFWDNTTLQLYDAPGGLLPDVLSAMWGSSADNLYAVGHTVTPFTFGYALRFDGLQWRLTDSGAERPATSLHGASATELILGTRGGGLLRAVKP